MPFTPFLAKCEESRARQFAAHGFKIFFTLKGFLCVRLLIAFCTLVHRAARSSLRG